MPISGNLQANSSDALRFGALHGQTVSEGLACKRELQQARCQQRESARNPDASEIRTLGRVGDTMLADEIEVLFEGNDVTEQIEVPVK